MIEPITLSSLCHTWLIDLDGTILKHNGYLNDGYDSLLPGAKEFLESIPISDKIIFLTSRDSKYKNITEQFLQIYSIRYDMVVYDLPYGERILINDTKPRGLKTAISINLGRDSGINPSFYNILS